MHVEIELLMHDLASPVLGLELRENQLELVEETRMQRDVFGPHVLLIVMRQEVAEPQMFGDREVEMLRIDLEEMRPHD